MSDSTTMTAMMEAYALDAVDHARLKFDIDLDFSTKSIKQVEEILGRLHKGLPRGITRVFRRPPSEEVLDTICKMYGGYIGEVYRRNFGGTWDLLTNAMGQKGQVIAFSSSQGDQFFPPSKVWKRLIDGAGDDVSFYFQVLAQRAKGDPE